MAAWSPFWLALGAVLALMTRRGWRACSCGTRASSTCSGAWVRRRGLESTCAPRGADAARRPRRRLVTLWGMRLRSTSCAEPGRGRGYRYARCGSGTRDVPLPESGDRLLAPAVLLWAISAPSSRPSEARGRPVSRSRRPGPRLFRARLRVRGRRRLAARALPSATRTTPAGSWDRGLWRYTRHPNYFGDAAVCGGGSSASPRRRRVVLDRLQPASHDAAVMRVSG